MPDILSRAAALGIAPPVFTEAARPGLWDRWQSRVLLAEHKSKRGVDVKPLIREAAIYGGHPVEPSTREPGGPLLDLDLFRQLRGSVLDAAQTVHRR